MQRFALVPRSRAVAAEQIMQGGRAACKRHDFIIDAGSPDVALDQTGMTLVVFDHDDGNRLAH